MLFKCFSIWEYLNFYLFHLLSNVRTVRSDFAKQNACNPFMNCEIARPDKKL